MTTFSPPIDPTPSAKRAYRRSPIRFPAYTLGDSVAVAKVVHDRGGGFASPEQLAAFLGYTSTNNGAYLNRVSAAKMFGLITSESGLIRLTPRGTALLMPTYQEDARRALVEAFLDVPLFNAVYEATRGQPLPQDFGLKNLLRTKFGVTSSVVDTAYRTLMASAEDAGFFATRGARTHLIMPTIASAQPSQDRRDGDAREGEAGDQGDRGSGGGGNSPPPYTPQTREDLQNAYVATLIDLLREKGKQGDVDAALMERIEKLLDLHVGE